MIKKFILALAAVCSTVPVFAASDKNGVMYDATVLRVRDGDTVVIAAPWIPAPMKPEIAVRIYGVDTPEKGARAQCPQENEKALMASKFTKDVINASMDRKVVLYAWDKFGGRVLGDLVLDGKSLRAGLIANGLAREYFGDAKQTWCN